MLGNGRLLVNQRQNSASGLAQNHLGNLGQGSGQGVRSGSSLLAEHVSRGSSRETRQMQISERQNLLMERIKTREVGKTIKYGAIEAIAEERTNRGNTSEGISRSIERQANLSHISGPMEEVGISTAGRDGKGMLIYDQGFDQFQHEEYFSPQEYNPGSRTFGN